MGFKFTKSIKLGKLFRLNVNKKSKSVTVGGKNLKSLSMTRKKSLQVSPAPVSPTIPRSTAKRNNETALKYAFSAVFQLFSS